MVQSNPLFLITKPPPAVNGTDTQLAFPTMYRRCNAFPNARIDGYVDAENNIHWLCISTSTLA